MPLSKTQRHALAEQQSLAIDSDLLQEARKNTQAVETDLPFLLTLAREICTARGRELTLAYKNLLKLAPGFRRQNRRANDPGTPAKTSFVCIVLMVKHKLALDKDSKQLLPRWLITYGQYNGIRQPFAIATDVREADTYHLARAHRGVVWSQAGDYQPQRGTFACVATLAFDGGTQRCLLSAQHVFSPYPRGDAAVIDGGHPICPDDANGKMDADAPMATSQAWGGLIYDNQDWHWPSLDVQLATIDNEERVSEQAAVRRLNAHAYAKSWEEVVELSTHGAFLVLVPNHVGMPPRGNLPCYLDLLPQLNWPIEYDLAYPDGVHARQVYHKELLGFTCDVGACPEGGDSGSAIVFEHDDGTMTIVAMYIGGNSYNNAWGIPAWCLFDLQTYWKQYPFGSTQLSPAEPL